MRITLFSLLILASGCLHTKIINPSAEAGETKDLRRTHYMGGFGLAEIQVDCPNGIKSIAEGRTFGDSMLTGLTLGIWNPSTARITCAK